METGSHPFRGALWLGALLAQAAGAPVGPASEGTKRFELEVELISPGATAQVEVEDGEHRGGVKKVGGRYALTRTLVVTDEVLGRLDVELQTNGQDRRALVHGTENRADLALRNGREPERRIGGEPRHRRRQPRLDPVPTG